MVLASCRTSTRHRGPLGRSPLFRFIHRVATEADAELDKASLCRPEASRLDSLSCEGSSVVIEPGRAVVVTLAPPMWLARQAKTGRKTLAAGDHVLLQPGYVGHHLAPAMAFTFLIRTLSLSPSGVRLCFAHNTLTCLFDSLLSPITLACCVTR